MIIRRFKGYNRIIGIDKRVIQEVKIRIKEIMTGIQIYRYINKIYNITINRINKTIILHTYQLYIN